MAYAKLSPNFFAAPPVMRSGNEGTAVFARCLSYAARHGKVKALPIKVALDLAGSVRALMFAVDGGLLLVDGDTVRFVEDRDVWMGFGGTIGRPKLPRRLRAQVIDRDGLVCGICGGDVEPSDVHIDHVHPLSRGGSDEFDNLQVAHSRCNIRKGARV